MTNVKGVEAVNWNPRTSPLTGRTWSLPVGPRVNNFGDLLGPMVIEKVVADRQLGRAPEKRRLVSVGSTIRLARDGDVVWGTGANGKSLEGDLPFSRIEVRAVRGPLTRDFLMARGFDVPEVYGDPGLLLGTLWPAGHFRGDGPTIPVTVIPNLHDLDSVPSGVGHVVNPTSPLRRVLSAIARSELVVGSSLHAIVLAEAFGVPARLVASGTEPEFKYRDYFAGTGRPDVAIAGSIAQAVKMGGAAPLEWDPRPLLEAFPEGLWSPAGGKAPGVTGF